jgi:protease-4
MSQPSTLSRASFRKRHPVIFSFLMLVLVIAAIVAGASAFASINRSGVFAVPRLGLVRVEGFIGSAEKTVEWVEALRRDPSVAGVLVRIDSSGGGVSPSQELYMAVKRLAEAKPVVISMGTVAASGGYYIAVAGNEIFANPSTITGSIGVRLQVSNVQGLMQRIGVTSESLTTGKFKAAGSPFQALTGEERAYLQGILNDMQEEFVSAVAKGRKLSKETVAALADGRIFTGRQALGTKLIDNLGDQQAALLRLAAMAKDKGVRLADVPDVVEGPPKKTPFWKKVLEAAVDMDTASSADTMRYTFCY